MKKMRRVWGAVILWCLLSATSFSLAATKAAQKPSINDIAAKVGEGVLILQGTTGTGHAWRIDKTHFVTCWHVVDGNDDLVMAKERGGQDFVPISPVYGQADNMVVAAADKKDDVAILVSKHGYLADDGISILSLAKQEQAVGDKVFQIDKFNYDFLVRQGELVNNDIPPNKNSDFVQAEFSEITEEGESGTPIFNSRGEVVGMVWGGDCIGTCGNMREDTLSLPFSSLKEVLAKLLAQAEDSNNSKAR